MPLDWDKAGCPECRQATGSTPDYPLQFLGEDAVGFSDLFVCEKCGQYWEQDTFTFTALSLSEAKAIFPTAFAGNLPSQSK